MNVLGREIVGIRRATLEELDRYGWTYRTTVLELDNNTIVFAASDKEGNSAGVMFSENNKGEFEHVFPENEEDY